MPKLNTYRLATSISSTTEFVAIIPGVGEVFETIRLSRDALAGYIAEVATTIPGEDGREIGSLDVGLCLPVLVVVGHPALPLGEVLLPVALNIQPRYAGVDQAVAQHQLIALRGEIGIHSAEVLSEEPAGLATQL